MSLFKRNKKNQRAFINAIIDGELQSTQKLRDKVNIHFNKDEPLLIACRFNKIEIVKYLVEDCGANIHANKNAAFMGARCLDVLKYLFKVGNINLNTKNHALVQATEQAWFHIVKYLIEECGADIHAKNELALRRAPYYGVNIDIMKYLIDKGADINAVKNDMLNYELTYSSRLKLIKYLIEEHGAEAKQSKIDSALRRAAKRGELEIVKYLVEECGANVNSKKNYTIRTAIKEGRLEVVKYLTDNDAA